MSLGSAALVLLGGFLGGAARFLVSGVIGARVGELFPWGTLVVNVTGAFAVGLLAGLGLGGGLRDFLIVGVCGGYTTVSSFALQALALALDGQGRQAALSVLASTGLAMLAVALGFWIAS
jgi:fluoride exporter